MENQILFQLHQKQIKPKDAYKELYPKIHKNKMRRAHFVKLKILVPDDKTATRILRILFAFPMPLFIVRLILRFVKEENSSDLPLTKKEIIRLISYRGIKVSVNTKSGEKILIKTI